MKFIRWMLHSLFTGKPQRLLKEIEALAERGERAAALVAIEEWQRLYGK